MAEGINTLKEAMAEIEDLRARLEEAEETIRAIQSGEVDAVVVRGPEGEQVYTLSGAERTHRILVEAMNEGALVLSPEGMVIYCNRTFAAMLGSALYDVLGHSVYEFVAESDTEHLRRMLEQAPVRAGRREITLRHNDTGSVPAFLSVANLDTEEGPSVSAVVTDLTEHKRTEAELAQYREHLEELVAERTRALAESEQRAIGILESISDGFMAYDSEWRFVYLNDEGERQIRQLTGLTREDLLGKVLWEQIPYLVDTPLYHNFRKAVEEQVPVIFEEHYPEAGRWFLVRAFPSRDGLTAYSEEITERKQAEEELAPERQLLQTVLGAIPTGVVFSDSEGNLTYHSPGAARIFGGPPTGTAAVPEPGSYEILKPDGTPFQPDELPLARCLRDGRAVLDIEMVIVRADGSRMTVLVGAAPTFDAEGRVTGAVAALQDISDRKQSEEDLRKSEERFRALVTASAQVVYRMSPDWSEMRNLRGGGFLADTETSDRTWLDAYIPQDDQPLVIAAIEEAIRTKGIFELEHRVMRADGGVGWTLSRAVPLLDADGEIAEWFGFANDITDRKRAEEELALARAEAEGWAAQLESFVTSMADGIALLDANGSVIMMNDAGKAVLGIPPDGSPDDWPQYPRYTLDGEPIPAADTASFRALRGELVRDARYKVVSPWGREVVISVSASPVRDSEGRIIGATNVFRDISDQVEFERQRQELYEREHHISQMLQQALIPSEVPYTVRGISISARYKPALKEAQVGGDFYDVFDLGEGKIGVLLGDVAGKGLRAAIRVAAARYAVRSYAYLDPSPSRVMTLTNDALCKEGANGEGVLTAFFAVVDTTSGTMTYASAGHEPPVVCNAQTGVEELSVTGAMLGIIPGITYDECRRDLRAGDQVVIFTDGITEARREGSILFEKSGVVEHLKKACEARPDEIAEALLEAATLHTGGSLQDDVAIVVLRFDGDG